jgi:hypothetical protein
MSRNKLGFETVKFTPQMASDLLDKHAHEKNRPLRQGKIQTYADDMRAGKWDLNGETVIIGDDETVLDGHHRLWACIMAETPFETAVVRGVDPKTFKTIDTGAHRTGADVVYITSDSRKYHRTVAGAALLIIRYESGKVLSRGKVLPREIATYFEEHPDLETWAEAANKGPMKPFGAPIAATTYLASGKYRARAADFVDALTSGAALDKGSPVLALRNRLLTPSGRLIAEERFALVTQGWNAYVEGRSLTRMQMFKGDKFPKIRGATR